MLTNGPFHCASSLVYDGTWLRYFAIRPLRLRDGRSHQLANAGRVQIASLRDAHVSNPFAVAPQQAIRIGKLRTEVKAEIDPIRMRGGEHERIARPLREREVVGDRVDLVDELVGLRSFFQD